MIEFPVIDLRLLWPELILALGATLLLLSEPGASRRQSRWPAVAALLIGVAAIASLWFTGSGGQTGDHMLWVDSFTQFFRVLILGSTLLVLLMAPAYVRRLQIESGEFYALILFAALGAILMAGAQNFVVLFLGLEVHSIALYVLAGSRVDRMESEESALKYLLLGAFASAFLLYGIALIYATTGTMNLTEVAAVLRAGEPDRLMLYAGVGLVIVGLGFKIAAVPFHMWTPDVYEGAPTVVTALMTVVPKAAAFAAVLRVFTIGLVPVMGHWQPIWLVLAVLTMSVGNLLALGQTSLKRLLAYSSIAHAGYLLVGVVAGTELGRSAVLYYLVAYALMNLGAFAVISMFERSDGRQALESYDGLAVRQPVVGGMLALFMFSLAGIPPTAGFMGKLMLFRAAVEAGHQGLAIIAVLNSVVAAYYYLRVVVAVTMREPSESAPPVVATPWGVWVTIAVAALGTLQFGLIPGFVYDFARASTRFLLG